MDIQQHLDSGIRSAVRAWQQEETAKGENAQFMLNQWVLVLDVVGMENGRVSLTQFSPGCGVPEVMAQLRIAELELDEALRGIFRTRAADQ